MAPSPTIRRLLKETQELSSAAKHPNPTFHAAPLSEDNLHEWHFTLLGPPAPSPYAGGIYHGRITLPPAYPMKPPNFRFLTPSGRFEVNREICLSISGFHEETWQPAWGVRLALTALRGFMGEEGTAGQVGGLESPKEVRERLARESKSWTCSGCGGEEEDGNRKGWTNEERMQWWWDVCRSKDVNVEAEVAGLEHLPEGMKVEARDTKLDKGKQKEEHIQDVEEELRVPPTESQHATSVAGVLPPTSNHTVVQQELTGPPQFPTSSSLSSSAAPATSQPSPGVLATSNVPTISYRPHNRGTSTDTTPTHQHRFQHFQQTQRRQADSPITIDRAIAGVFLALFIMILKKVFYPSSSGGVFGGYDDLRMMRE